VTKGVKRNYEEMPISEEDAAYVRGLVIHEDSGVLAFDKPSGLPVQTRNPDDRTLDRLLAAFARSNGKRPRLVHRLDAQTSGVIVAAKTKPAAADLSEAFAERLVSKTYYAVVTGSPLAEGETEFSMPLARHIARPGLELILRAARPGDQNSQAAVTRWRIVASRRPDPPARCRAADTAPDAPGSVSTCPSRRAHTRRPRLCGGAPYPP